ncbi:L-aminoadipate-semialdehyde dehydrogenase-phosphopantetheinyl transferase [Trichostrongylus colubriformis]|uniref:L-aminoadipate-semialdehyde dehydrogenase-phosphopantetheinyl transferase n=1 Tax=Trichostrongylus colubriformis TaxID=6319 RepID=A0AAN8G4V0_TRICO
MSELSPSHLAGQVQGHLNNTCTRAIYTTAALTGTMAEKMCKCNRWVVSVQSAFESDDFEKMYREAVQCITPEDFCDITKKQHQTASILGKRLLPATNTTPADELRRFTGTPWSEIQFGRTEKGKPFLLNPPHTTFGLNITHQGDFVGFASSCTSSVGVDVMRLDKERAGKTADDYINSMAKSASSDELRMMRSQPTEAMKMTMFYRYWCLKEAFLKATGDGIIDDLSRINFKVDMNDRYRPGCFVTSTTVLMDDKLQSQWIFEESFVNGNHAAAVCKEVSFDTLLKHASHLNPLPDNASNAYKEFVAKPRRTF